MNRNHQKRIRDCRTLDCCEDWYKRLAPAREAESYLRGDYVFAASIRDEIVEIYGEELTKECEPLMRARRPHAWGM